MSNFHSKWKQFLKEAQQDAKVLRNINIKRIQKDVPKGPEEEMRDYFARIQGLERDPEYQNPVFPTELIDWMESLPDNHFPRNVRKRFAKWLANEVYELESRAAKGHTSFSDLNVYNNDIRYITDYFNGAQDIPENVWSMDFDQMFKLSEDWHETFKGKVDAGPYETKDVVYDFGNGFTIVKVPPEDLGTEGDNMGHCVGGYCDSVETGATIIFSLRDPKNAPHVTIEVDYSGRVDQIKGKQNDAPVPKYRPMVKQWLKTTDFDYSRSGDYQNILTIEDYQADLEGDEFLENFSLAKAGASSSDPEVVRYILARLEATIAEKGGDDFLGGWSNREDLEIANEIMDALANNRYLEVPEIVAIAKLGYRVGIGSMIEPMLSPGSQQKYAEHYGEETNNILARAVYEEMKDELLDPTPREDDLDRHASTLRQQILHLSAIARQDPRARQEIVDFLLSPEMTQRLLDQTRPNNVVINILDHYLMTAGTEYRQTTKANKRFLSDAIHAPNDTVKKIFDFQMSELRKKLGDPNVPDRLLVRMAGLPKLPQEVIEYFVEYTANTSGVNNSKITERVILTPGVSTEVKKELIKNSFMKDEQHLPIQGYRYSAYAKIFSRRLREVLFKLQPELAQWVLDSGLLEPLFVESWRGSIAKNTGNSPDVANLNEKQTQDLKTSLKRQRKNIQRNISIKARKEKEKLQEQIQNYFGRERLTKSQFYNKIEETINEEKGRSRQRGIYKFYCMLSYGLTLEENRTRGLDDILADLRALPNVTIVTVVIKNQKIAEGRYIAGLSVKFIPSVPGQFRSPEDVKSRITRDIRRLSNVQSIFKVSAGLERLE